MDTTITKESLLTKLIPSSYYWVNLKGVDERWTIAKWDEQPGWFSTCGYGINRTIDDIRSIDITPISKGLVHPFTTLIVTS